MNDDTRDERVDTPDEEQPDSTPESESRVPDDEPGGVSDEPELTSEDETAEGGDEQTEATEAIEEALAELSLDEQLEATRAERDENFDKWQRAVAELDNFRRRAGRDAEEARTYQALPLARDLLPGLDNLQRAIQAASSNEAAADVVEWVRMVLDQVIGVLGRHGVEPIESVGEAFDPAVHEAIQQVPSDEHEPMTVLEEVEGGFRLGDRVVRPAKVIVSMAPPAATDEVSEVTDPADVPDEGDDSV